MFSAERSFRQTVLPNWLISQRERMPIRFKEAFQFDMAHMEIAGNDDHRDRTVEFLERAAKLEGITPEQYLLRVAEGKLLKTEKPDE